jgi:hypothetical protein
MMRRNFRVSAWLESRLFRGVAWAAFLLAGLMVAAQSGAQSGGNERTYRQSKSAVEKALRELQASMSGRLPVLDGFALAGDHPLDRYQRAYFQSDVQVSSTALGGSLVRVNTKVTAWYADANPARSGYQLLTSNGRLESDLLDELTDLLATRPGAVGLGGNSGDSSGGGENSGASFPAGASASSTRAGTANPRAADAAIAAAPVPQFPQTEHPFSTAQGLSPQQLADSKNLPKERAATGLQAEAASLEEVLQEQAHPKNLVAVKKSGTPVVASPSLSGKTLFLASAQDEFEMLDFNADWVHVRISGLSRGWIWRTSLEMPQGISDVPLVNAKAAPVAADLFQVTREETAPFPGDWVQLRGKNVKIISVQKIQENEENSGAQAKLEFTKSLLDKNYADLAAKAQEVSGIVMIFDSVDGGMIAATLSTVQQWKAGKLTDAALWHQCYFDPPETFTVAGPAGGG